MAGKAFYTPQEMADLLEINKNTVYNLIRRGDIDVYKIGQQYRIPAAEIEKLKISKKRK